MERWSIGLALPVGAKVRAAGRLTASGLPPSSTKQPNPLVGCHPSYRTRYQFNGRIRCDRPVVCARGRAEPQPGFSCVPFEKLFDLVVAGNVAKFGQNQLLRDHLLGSSDAILVEAAPRNQIWGIGFGRGNPAVHDPLRWRGRNLLGFALVKVRGILRGELISPKY